MIISKTPLRISLFGGGTDFPEYFKNQRTTIIGGTIDKYIYITIKKTDFNQDKKNIKIFYKNNEFVKKVTEIKHKVIKKIFKDYKLNKNVELHIISDLPSNSGLGSSSAFTCGMINLIEYFVSKRSLNEKKLANKTILYEREKLKENVGFQDQIFASYGGFNKIDLKKDFKVKRFDCLISKKLEKNLYLIHTKLFRRANDIEKKKIKNIKFNKKYLDKINEIAAVAEDKMNKNISNLDFIGFLLNQTWQIKKKLDSKVSNHKIDLLYQKGLNSGASGGKLLGAGSGGFMLFYVPDCNIKDFKIKMRNYKPTEIQFSNKGSEILKV